MTTKEVERQVGAAMFDLRHAAKLIARAAGALQAAGLPDDEVEQVGSTVAVLAGQYEVVRAFLHTKAANQAASEGT